MEPKIIGIAGKAFTGKDTVASMIFYALNYPDGKEFTGEWEMVSFAAPLKRSVEAIMGLPCGAADNRGFRKEILPGFDFTLAKFLQDYGQLMRDKFGQDFWIRTLFKHFTSAEGTSTSTSTATSTATPKRPKWIISDVRYPNESEAIKRSGGIVLKIECNDEALARHEASSISPILAPSSISSFGGGSSSAMADGRDPKHSSETSLDGVLHDRVITNNGSIEELRKEVRKVLKEFKIL
jgi:hypothetical protein